MSKKPFFVLIFISLVFLITVTAVAYGRNSYERKIVLFDKSCKPAAQDALVTKHGLLVKRLHLVNAVVALVPSDSVDNLAREKGVLDVESDAEVYALNQAPAQTSTQLLPWGVTRVNANLVWPVSDASSVKVGVIDSGISLNHSDLASNIKGGFNAINRRQSADDDNGHGTHVAGIIAAVDNDIGVIGIAPKAQLYAVKVLDKTGSGRISNVIEGVQWCMDNNMQVVNMSLGTSSYSKALHNAVKKAHESGLVMVAAAGNSGPGEDTIAYPAKFSEVIAVSAIDENSGVTSWSSRGPEIDVAAPGNSIYSTYANGEYRVLSGTSMAAPHVTGVISLKLHLSPELTPVQIMDLLKRSALNMPNATSDEQGAGLVDAYNLMAAR